MQRTTVKSVFLALIRASALPLAACGDDDTPTSPTQPGPPVGTPDPTPPTTPPTTDPTPDDPTPPTQPPATVSITGFVSILERSGAGDLDISFRIDDFTVVRADADTPVIVGSQTFRTDAVRPGQQVNAIGTRTNGVLDATRIEIIAQAP